MAVAPADETATRYVAFISYSHVDQATARWLHRALEGYRVPRRVVRRSGGEVPRRLAPVFLDREELSSSANLGEAVRLALQRSAALIVICSPDAAASRWVNEEIRLFKALGREDRILCLIVAGEPLAADRGLPAATECFPPALRHAVVDGQVTATRAGEPLAADMRAGADNRRGALLRLVAGLLHVDLDLLRQREHARWQRRLVLVGAAAIVACSVFAALALAAWLARGEAERQRQLAEQKSLTARRTADFLVSLFRVADPSEARGNSITAREILDRGARQIDSSLREEPVVRAELSTTLGEVYRGLGLYGPALDLLSKSRAIDAQDPDGWVRATLSLAELELQRGNDARSDTLFAEAADRYARLGGADPQVRAQLLLGRGGAAAVLQRSAEAQSYFEQALVLGRASGLAVVQAEALEGLAMNHFYAGEFTAAESDYQRALEARIAVSGETHPKVSESLNGLAATAYMRGDAARAEAYWQRVLRIDRRLLGPRHPDLAATMNNLGRLWLERRDYARAVAMLADAVAILGAQQSATHEDLMYAYSNLALAHMGRDDDREARPLLQRALEVAQANDHALQGPIIAYQADLDCRDGRYRNGLQRVARARPLIAARYAGERWRAAQLRSIEARCLAGLQRISEAVQLVDSGTPEVLGRWPAYTAFGHDAVARALYVYGLAAERGKLAYYQAQDVPVRPPEANNP